MTTPLQADRLVAITHCMEELERCDEQWRKHGYTPTGAALGWFDWYDELRFLLYGDTMALPQDHQARKALPIYSGVIRYFPDALAEVARVSYVGNEQHNPGEPLHWDRSKSGDELDALARHLLQANELDEDGCLHAAKLAWRALAYLQKLMEHSPWEPGVSSKGVAVPEKTNA